jgi:hypothetical protein
LDEAPACGIKSLHFKGNHAERFSLRVNSTCQSTFCQILISNPLAHECFYSYSHTSLTVCHGLQIWWGINAHRLRRRQ